MKLMRTTLYDSMNGMRWIRFRTYSPSVVDAQIVLHLEAVRSHVDQR
jgi:hypothetical protein